MKADGSYDGVYYLTDSGRNREQLVTVKDGFYTWRYLTSEDGDEKFEPWPTLVKPDGSLFFEMEMTTVMEMTGISRMDYSTYHIETGNITPGTGIYLQELTATSGMGNMAGSNEPRILSGTAVREGEFPNEQIPPDAAAVVAERERNIRTLPGPGHRPLPAGF
ncbi:hypothetical protein K7I13_14315 [Brucepastera parasyntrophica]|uniref:hypothetical protein n=1 Tax=Brucepastera parasyntrophica TaxID=2880008 RepID=UPI00210EDC6C|nr:hypothetical protein [Brucepastera parasyntrophica]ULQ59615.1 hypothetical protein K7I13_14315 [Brucepastera parasyntrophica]